MKVRVGVGLGAGDIAVAQLGQAVDAIVDLGLDSLWLSEVLTQPGPDPLATLAWAAAHNPRIKLGTTLLAPGRNLVRMAKALATVDQLSGGRLLVTLVPGLPRGAERGAVGPPPAQRGTIIDEVMPVLRQLWAGHSVSYHGVAGDFDDVTVRPLPVQDPLEMWLGGMTPAALRRCGALGDGWLPALCTPDEAVAGRTVIDEAAAAAGREISPEHFGISIGYATEPLSPKARQTIEARSRGRRAEELVPIGFGPLRATLEQFVDAGFSKFVARPLRTPDDWPAELTALAAAVGDLQT